MVMWINIWEMLTLTTGTQRWGFHVSYSFKTMSYITLETNTDVLIS